MHLIQSLLLSYFRFLASKSLNRINPTIIGIAGSVGKSSTKSALEAVLKDYGSTKSVGNSETGIPLGILGLKPTGYSVLDWLKLAIKAPFGINYLKNTKYLIVEMGIDDPFPPKNMGYLLTIIKPDIAVVLNESATHSLQFEKSLSSEEKSDPDEKKLNTVIQKISDEDCRIITDVKPKLAIYNADDKFINASLKNFDLKVTELMSFGNYETNDISYLDYRVSLDSTEFSFGINNEKLSIKFRDSLLPREYQSVLAPVILIAKHFGIELPQIKKSLESNYKLPKGRSSIFKGINNSVIIDSTYNASKSSTLAFLKLLKTLKKKYNKKTVFIFGDMRELGKQSRIEHEQVADQLIGAVDYLYCVGPLTQEFVLPVIQNDVDKFNEVRWFRDSKLAGDYLSKNLPKDSIILAKGSQNTIYLEEAVKKILEDKSDYKNLCRQDDFFINSKKKFFESNKII